MSSSKGVRFHWGLKSFHRGSEIFDQCAQRLRNRPGLSKTPARKMRRVGIENLGDLSETGLAEMSFEAIQKSPRF